MIKNSSQSVTRSHKKSYILIALVVLIALIATANLTFFNKSVSNIGTSSASAEEPADINSDSAVDIVDLSILLSNWNTADNLSDINNDNIVDIVDLSILLSKWGNVVSGSVTTYLPFDLPDNTTLRSSDKKIFANYFIPHLISFDNADPANDTWQTYYLNNQKTSTDTSSPVYWFAAHGGAYRDRPIGRSPINCTNDPSKSYYCWELEDMKTEVENAINAGLDGFELNILSSSTSTTRNWAKADALIDAALAVDPGFKIIMTPDLNSSHWGNIDASTMAADLKHFMVKPDNSFKDNIYINEYGKAVVSPFPANKIQAGGERAITYWSDVNIEFSSITGGLELSWWPQLSDYTYSKAASVFDKWTKAYTESPIFDAVTYWSNAVAKNTIVSTAKLRADIAHGLDTEVDSVDSEGNAKKWIQPLHVTDYRPIRHEAVSSTGKYDESNATETLRSQWDAAIKYADYAQFITWNDYSETAVSPSVGHGFGYLDLSTYYLVKFKTGSYPTITRDAVYLTHRKHKANATPKCASYTSPKIPCTLLMLKTNSNPDYDKVESTVFLTAPATLEVTVGSQVYTHSLPAGMSVVDNDLSDGVVSAKIVRNSSKVAGVTSPYIVTSSPEVQDMQYHIVSSLRDPN